MVANVVELGAGAAIQRQARKWLVRLDGDEPLTDAEARALREWMSCSASHREELVRLSRFWSHANILNELIGGVDARRREQKERRWRRWMRRAALLVAGAVGWARVGRGCRSRVGTNVAKRP